MLSLLPILGTFATSWRSSYGNREQSTTFHVVIEAPPASGKSFTTELVRTIYTPYYGAEDARQMELYTLARKAAKGIGHAPSEKGAPRLLPITQSTSALLQVMANAGGRHLLTFGEEIDQVTAQNQGFNQKSEIYRLAFDNAEAGQLYMDAETYSGKVALYLNILCCGTPAAVRGFLSIKAEENGLASRFIRWRLEDQTFKPFPQWQPLTSEQQDTIHRALQPLCDAASLAHKPFQPKNLDLKWLEDDVRQWDEEKRQQAILANDTQLDRYRRRSAVIGFRAGLLACALLGIAPTAQQSRKEVCSFARLVAEMALQGFLTAYSRPQPQQRISHYRRVYDALPESFTTAQLKTLLNEFSIKREPRKVLSDWKTQSALEKLSDGTFRKVS